MINRPQISIAELESAGEASLQTGPFGTQLKAADYASHGTPVINVRNIGLGTIRDDDLEFLPERQTHELRRHALRSGDIVFGRKGAVERHALIDAHAQGWIQGSDCLRLRISSPKVDERFLSYYLRTAAHQQWMQALCSFGATMNSLNQEILRRLTFPCPPIEVQRKVSGVLAAYDELIANNQGRIALLERMAEEIYCEWFVRLRFPGHEHVARKKGLPSGWRYGSLNEIAQINSRSLKRGSLPEEINYIDIGSVGTNRVADAVKMKLQHAPGRARRVIADGDIIWSSVRPSNRAYCLMLDPEPNTVVSTGFAVITPRPGVPYTFVHRAVTTDSFVEQVALVAKGSAYPATAFEDFGRAQILLPPEFLASKFHSLCDPLVRQAALLTRANVSLACSRDALLPRLISGKLSVEDLDIRQGCASELAENLAESEQIQ